MNPISSCSTSLNVVEYREKSIFYTSHLFRQRQDFSLLSLPIVFYLSDEHE